MLKQIIAVLETIYSHLFTGWAQSYFPLITFILIPGKSWVRPASTNTTLCSCRVCPTPGMYAVNSFPLLSLTLQHLRWAEFGFLGLRIMTCNTIPFIWGLPSRTLFFLGLGFKGPFRIIWFIVLKCGELEWIWEMDRGNAHCWTPCMMPVEIIGAVESTVNK